MFFLALALQTATLADRTVLMDGNDPPLTFVRSIAVGSEGTSYILDGGDKRVWIVGPTGRVLGSFGGEGAGPGEFIAPMGVTVRGPTVVVLDLMQQRTSTFSLEGEHVETRKIPAPEGGALSRIAPLRHGWVLALRAGKGIGDMESVRRTDDEALLFRSDGSGSPEILARWDPGFVLFRLPSGSWGGASASFGPQGGWAVSGDSLVALVDGYSGAIEFRSVEASGLKPFLAVDLRAHGHRLEQADYDAVEKRLRESKPGLPRQIQLFGPAVESIFNRFLFDDSEHLWMDGRDGDGWTRIDVPTGFFEEVRPPEGFTLLAVAGDLLYGVERSDLDVPSVVRYRLVR